ncbi:MAG: sigma-70 family RNA polymerase sigma factor [Deltaproteobacteria bacterium]|nr:sigma-70 family RNA polymerase sigma factor [Deltaproteobacteria bacterium]
MCVRARREEVRQPPHRGRTRPIVLRAGGGGASRRCRENPRAPRRWACGTCYDRRLVSKDFELLAQWRDGDKAAGNALFQRHFKAMRRFFRNKVGPEEVEDLIQRTFLACVESRDRFRGDSTFRTYLYVVARNELFRHIRKRARDEVRAGLDFTVSSLFDLGLSPSKVVAKQQEEELVLEALRRIPVDQQILLELYYWEQVPGPELARVLEVAPATVRTRLFRARDALRKQMEKMAASPALLEDLEASVQAVGRS